MRRIQIVPAFALATAIALTVAGCGSTGNNAATNSSSTVSTRAVPSVGTVLVNSVGMTLYFTDQESAGSILCAGPCEGVWKPLTVPSGTTPTAGSGVNGVLGTVTRPDGLIQVTYGGKPLYLFSFDTTAGQAQGNGVSDNFGGKAFLWHAATTSGQAPAPSPSGGPSYRY